MLRAAVVVLAAIALGGCGGGGGEEKAKGFAPGTTWQWQLAGGKIDTSLDVDVYDVDLIDNPASWIEDRHAEGRRVLCYFSAGSYEKWRPDASDFPSEVLGEPLDGWPGERWVDVRASSLRDIMRARLDLAADKGCDGVEPDNVDGYANFSGFSLTGADQLDYNRFLAKEAHARGLSVGLKNDIEQLGALVDDFDWALNEECFTYHECGAYEDTFIAAKKAVFHAEYVPASELDRVCAVTEPLGLSTIVKHLDLDDFRLACP
jgi:hypothetical protein